MNELLGGLLGGENGGGNGGRNGGGTVTNCMPPGVGGNFNVWAGISGWGGNIKNMDGGQYVDGGQTYNGGGQSNNGGQHSSHCLAINKLLQALMGAFAQGNKSFNGQMNIINKQTGQSATCEDLKSFLQQQINNHQAPYGNIQEIFLKSYLVFL